MNRKPQIFTRTDDQMVPVDMGTLDMLAQEEEEELLVREFIQKILAEKKLRGQGKDKRLLYHINRYRPAKPQPKMTYMQDWDPDKIDPKDGERGTFVNIPGTNSWDRWWMDSPVKSGVFLTPNPLDIAMNHGRSGHVYAYRVPEWVINKSGGMHRYDHGSELLVPEAVWNEAGDEIEFLGKSLSKEELWEKMDSSIYGRGHHRKSNKPSWLTDEELKQWEEGQSKFNLSGLRATKHPEDVIKMLTADEQRKAIEAIEAKKEDIPGFVEKGPNDKKGIVVPSFGQQLDKKDEELLALLKKHLKESLLRETVRGILNEGIEFRTLDSPLTYNRAGNVKRIALCDTSVKEPNPSRDAYFNEYQEMERYGVSGRRLKKPRKGKLVPGVSDDCVIGFLDYHQLTKNSDGSTYWYIDYMKTRGDKGGQGTASKLIDEFYNTVPKPGDNVHFGKMMRKEIGHLKDKMKDKYPEIDTIGAVYY